MKLAISPIATVGWFSSLCIHAAAVACLVQSAHRERLRQPPATVMLTVVSPSRETRPVPPTATRKKAPNPTQTFTQSRAPGPAPESTKPAAPVKDAPVDLGGVTLTGGDGAGWSSMTGNGVAMTAPIVPKSVLSTTSQVPSASGAARVRQPASLPVEIVLAKDLASKPTPPALNDRLLSNYPRQAKQQGLAGSAKLLVRIDPDGLVRQCTVQAESNSEFGAACRQTLLGTQWSAPRNRFGQAVATQVFYTCEFRVNGS